MKENKISCRQLRRMIFVEGFGAAGLTFPAVAAWKSQSEGMLPIMLYVLLQAGFVGWLLFWIRKLEKKYPSAMEDGYGFVLGKGLGALYLLRLFFNSLALFYFFGLSIQKIYMPHASLIEIWLPFALLLWYCAQTTLQKRARFIELLFPWVGALVLLLILFAFLGTGGEWHSLEPKDTVPALLRNAYGLLLCVTPLEFLLFLVPASVPHLWREEQAEGRWHQKRKKQVWLAAASVAACNVLLWLATVQKLGGPLAAASPWPVAKVMQLIHLPGKFLERVDILLVMFWILCLAGVLSGYLYYGRKIGEEVFARNKREETVRRLAGRLTAVAVALLLVISWALSESGDSRFIQWFFLYKKWVDFPLLLFLPVLAMLGKKHSGKAAAMLLLCCLPLCGCRHQGDVEEKSYVLSLYVEKGEGDFVYWISTADLAGMEDKEDKIPCTTIHFRAENMEELERKYAKTEPGELEWNHIETIFIGPGLAGDEEKTEAFLREWEASWQKSPDVLLCVCEQGPEELMDVKNIPEGAAGQEVRSLVEQSGQGGTDDGKRRRRCRTPMDVLKAMDAGEDNISVYGIKVQWKRLVLQEKILNKMTGP